MTAPLNKNEFFQRHKADTGAQPHVIARLQNLPWPIAGYGNPS